MSAMVPPMAQPPRRPISLVWAGVCLAFALAGAKAVLVPAAPWSEWLLNFARASFQDVVFAVGAGVIGELAVRLAPHRVSRALRGACLGFFVVCALYSVVSVGVFAYFGRPLNYDLLGLVRSAAPVRSSITQRLTLPVVMALIGVPLVYLALAFWGGRYRRVRAFAATAVVAWSGTGGWQYAALSPNDQNGHRLARNPHVELFRSTVAGLTRPARPSFPQDFPPGDIDEFRSFGARGGAPVRGFTPPAAATPPRNVIVLILESVGTKYLSLYGSEYETTPVLASEAAHSLVFEDFYAHASYTYYSFRALNFSVYPGLPWAYLPWAGRPLPPTLASVLSARGWRTIYLNNGDLNWDSARDMIEGRGYDSVEDYRDLGCAPLTSWGAEDRCLIDRLVRWIDEKRDQPFFAMCWTDQTHDPYRQSPGVPTVDFFLGKASPRHAGDLSRYLNVLRETDRQLGRLFTALRERGLADDTLIVVTGDHGESFSDPHEQRGHSLTIFDEEVKVPLMLWNPRLFSGRRMTEVGAHVDLNPTIADVLGIAPPGEWQGHSLFNPARPPRAFFQTNHGEYLFGVREGPWKYIFEATTGREMLFDLSRDREELKDVASREQQLCKRLRQRIAAWVTFEEDFLRGVKD